LSQQINKKLADSPLPPPDETGVLSVSEIFAGSDSEPVGDIEKPYVEEIVYGSDTETGRRVFRWVNRDA
jgi:hypothetical protein